MTEFQTPLIPGESAYKRKLRLVNIWAKTHAVERKAYEKACRARNAELRRAANPPRVEGIIKL